MKFARYLEENAVDEWRRAYINYRGLKKLIKRVDEHHEERKLLLNVSQPQRQASDGPATRLLRKGQGIVRGMSTDAYGRGYGTMQDDREIEAQVPLPPVLLKGTGLRLKEEEEVGDEEGVFVDEEAEEEGVTSTSHHLFFQRRDEDEVEQPARKTRFKDGEVNRSATWVVPGDLDNTDVTFDELIEMLFDKEERKFFSALDHELARIVSFFDTQEQEAIERLSTLVAQLQQLQEHRREFKTRTRRLSGGAIGLSRLLAKVPRGVDAEEVQRLKLSVQNREMNPAPENVSSDEDMGDKRRAQAMEHVQNLHIANLRTDSVSPSGTTTSKSFDPVHYKAARKKLREACIENYRALEILNNYRILNRTAFMKILKKFDKTLEVHTMHKYYDQRVMTSSLVQSEAVPKMLHAIEEVFACYFEHGNRKRARDILRSGSSQTILAQFHGHHGSTFRTGLYLGLALGLAAEGLRGALQESTPDLIPSYQTLMVMYATLFIPTLFALLFGLNLIAWQRVRINTVFIFEFDARHALEPTQYFEMPALLLFLLSICWYASFVGNPAWMPWSPTTWPLVWLLTVVALLVNPLEMMHKSSRYWMLRSLARVCTGGVMYSVEFRDFFLGDELNSLAYSVSNMWVFACEYDHGWYWPDQCAGTQTYWTPVLSALPATLRLTQCLRRYIDTNGKMRIHLVNAFKYLSSILNALFYFRYRQAGSQGVLPHGLWVLFATINSLYTCTWDIAIDWNLLQKSSRYPLLRSHLAYDDIWPMYYVAMVVNIMIRFVWVIYLFGDASSVPLRAFVAAMLEMLRRWQWNFVRLENEHLGNADSFKIVRDLPLPYPVRRRHGSDYGDEDEYESESDTRTLGHGSQMSTNESRIRDALRETQTHLDEVRQRRTTTL